MLAGAISEGIYQMIRKVLFTAVMGSLLLGATACATVKGMGKDIQSVGQASEDAMNGH